jgi:uncharacterized protein (TIGR03437 family)
LALLILAWVLAGFADAQFVQQGGKLVGTGSADQPGGAQQGSSVALSSDGSTAIVGGPLAAWVYTRSGAVWVQQGSKLVGTDGFGASVALSADGNTAVVGAPGDSVDAGAAWVYTRSGGVWTQQGGKLAATGVGAASQGSSVALSADGNTVIMGGPGGAGGAWVYTRSGGVWTQQGGELVGTGAIGDANQGFSVALSADGNTAIVGGPHDNFTSYYLDGTAWVYTRSGGVWTQQGSKLFASPGSETYTYAWEAQLGFSVALSGDGNTALVGGPGDDNYAGAGWVFARSGGVWTQQGSKLVGGGAVGFGLQGESMALSSDGNTALVGGPGDSPNCGSCFGVGATWVYTRSAGVWTQQGAKLVGAGAVGEAQQGSSVALSADATTAIVGGPGDDAGSGDNEGVGAAWVFVASTSVSSSVPLIAAGGVVGASAFGEFPSVAPGSWIEIYGANLAADSRSWTAADFNGVNAPTSLDATEVTIGGQSAFIDYISPTQVNAQVPSNVAYGSQPLIVTAPGGTSAAYNVTVNAAEPGLDAPPSFNIGGIQYVVALFPDGSYVLPAGAIAGLNSRPAKPGDTITLYGVGFGAVKPDIPAGQLVQELSTLSAPFSISFGGEPATFSYDGLAPSFMGLYQFNVEIPAGAVGNQVPVTFALGGVSGTQDLYIAVQE